MSGATAQKSTATDRSEAPKARRHAVVIGGSMGGLLAARVLADYFQSVTIVERDEFPPIGENRRGVPQGHHVHGLFGRGSGILERLFPHLLDELAAGGALRGDPGFRARLIFDGHPTRRVVTGEQGITLSRPLLEGHVRRRVLSLDNVEALQGHSVTGVITANDRQRVEGVRVKPARTDAPEEELVADLVVDASGRGSQSPRWLEEMGYSSPPEEIMEIGLRYMTRRYRRRPEHLDGDRAILLAPKPPSGRAAFVLAIEGLEWIVTLQNYFGDQPPTDEQGFRDFAATLAAPDLAELLADAEPCSEAVAFNYPASHRHRYERMRRFPLGYLVFGDALCSFNPAYGQGMTVAAIEATLLQDCLRSSNDEQLAQRFFRAAVKPIEAAWSISAGGDLRFNRVEGPRPPMVRFANWYLSHVFATAETDTVVAQALLEVVNFEALPPSLMRPSIALRVLRDGLHRRRPGSDEMRHAIWTSVQDVLRDTRTTAKDDAARTQQHALESRS